MEVFCRSVAKVRYNEVEMKRLLGLVVLMGHLGNTISKSTG
jgi:hypothetical protein